LPKIINPDQTGYVKGRYICENVRLIQDIMFYTKRMNSPGIAIFLVFQKAFDSIEWEYLRLLDEFKSISGLEINTSKTEAMWLGCWIDKVRTPFNFKWPKEPIGALGIYFSYNTEHANKLNFEEKINNL